MMKFRFRTNYSGVPGWRNMVRTASTIVFAFLSVLFWLSSTVLPQSASASKSSEVSDDDGLPVLVKHLPDWQDVRQSTVFITNAQELKAALGERPVLAAIEFVGGTEAVAADYPAGRLLIVEFSSPQGSADADTKALDRLAVSPDAGIIYRRIGNYNAFVFDAPDPQAAIALLDRVKYQKTIQWLGDDPFLAEKFGRYFAITSRDILISTVMWIVGGLGLSAVLGTILGLTYFRLRQQKRSGWTRFSDAGGMTRLNLDELSE